MGKATKSETIVFGSAIALMAAGIAVIVIGTWLTVPEELGQRDEVLISKRIQPPPQPQQDTGPVTSGMGGAATERQMYPKALVSLPAYSVDGQELGQVVMVSVSTEGEIRHIFVESPEFLGLGTKVVRIPAGMYERKNDHVELALTADAVNMLPEVE